MYRKLPLGTLDKIVVQSKLLVPHCSEEFYIRFNITICKNSNIIMQKKLEESLKT